jgi:restriction endonuclease S subunit
MPTDKLGSFPIVVPPLSEQVEIREYCHDISVSVENIVASVRRQLVQLRELKATLVTTMVSGKGKA